MGKQHLILNLRTSLLLRKSYFPLPSAVSASSPDHLVIAIPPTPTSPFPAALWPGSHPPAAISGSSEAAFTQLLKGQISSMVSSLSAFSNHSHGFCALHPNCAFDYWGHFVPSAFPEVTEISCVQSRPRESGGLSPFIHLHWFPLGLRVARVVPFPFLYSHLTFFLHLHPISPWRKVVCSDGCGTEANPGRKRGKYGSRALPLELVLHLIFPLLFQCT